MRAIQKGPEPRSLTEHRASGNADYLPDYDNYQHKDDLRRSLVAEQGAICCYCMQRIRPTQGGMKIEHWHCQRDYADEQLNYGNLLGACPGGQGEPYDRQHCDTRKAFQALSKNPANPAHQVESFIRFLGDGVIESPDPTLNQELNDVLNLNLPWHRTNRVAVLQALVAAIPKRQGAFTREVLLRWIADWNGDGDGGGDRRPYCHVVVYWLRKKLARVT
jgi:uncharacterized protein (TIGR02646 family)